MVLMFEYSSCFTSLLILFVGFKNFQPCGRCLVVSFWDFNLYSLMINNFYTLFGDLLLWSAQSRLLLIIIKIGFSFCVIYIFWVWVLCPNFELQLVFFSPVRLPFLHLVMSFEYWCPILVLHLTLGLCVLFFKKNLCLSEIHKDVFLGYF